MRGVAGLPLQTGLIGGWIIEVTINARYPGRVAGICLLPYGLTCRKDGRQAAFDVLAESWILVP